MQGHPIYYYRYWSYYTDHPMGQNSDKKSSDQRDQQDNLYFMK